MQFSGAEKDWAVVEAKTDSDVCTDSSSFWAKHKSMCRSKHVEVALNSNGLFQGCEHILSPSKRLERVWHASAHWQHAASI